MKAWHVTQPENVDSILATGLEPRDPAQHNYRADHVNAGIEAVYVWTSYDGVRRWLLDDKPEIVLELDVDGLPIEQDPYYAAHGDEHGYASRVLAHIEPERIKVAA